MPRHERPPKGYQQRDFPLKHYVSYNFGLQAEDETKNSTICTLFRYTDLAVAPFNIDVHPNDANYAEDQGAIIHYDSIIPKVNLKIMATLTKGAIETDKVRSIILNWMPIYTAFVDSLDSEDEKTGNDIEGLIELQHDTTNKDVYPLFAGPKLTDGSAHPLSTVPLSEALGDVGLTTTAVLESVAFDKTAYFSAMRYYTNKGMLKKVTGRMKSILVTRDRPYIYTSSNFTQPMVKRGNPYTFCGILFHLPQGGSVDQTFRAGDTTAISHLNITMQANFSEWNNNFDQSPL